MEDLKFYTEEEALDLALGQKGTPERDQYEENKCCCVQCIFKLASGVYQIVSSHIKANDNQKKGREHVAHHGMKKRLEVPYKYSSHDSCSSLSPSDSSEIFSSSVPSGMMTSLSVNSRKISSKLDFLSIMARIGHFSSAIR